MRWNGRQKTEKSNLTSSALTENKSEQGDFVLLRHGDTKQTADHFRPQLSYTEGGSRILFQVPR